MDSIDLFDYAPISLWEEDFSQVKKILDELRRQGVTDLCAYAVAHPGFVIECMGAVDVLRVNRRTLNLFGANSQEHLVSNLGAIFRDEMRIHFLDELVEIWNGAPEHHLEGINYSLSGEPVHVLLHWQVLPGFETSLERVLVSLTDIRQRKQVEQKLMASEAHYHGLFEHSPISLWEEDYSEVKRFLEDLRRQGVEDLSEYLDQNPEAVPACMQKIRVLDVNRKTLEMYGAQDKETLLKNLHNVFRDAMGRSFRDELLDMWSGQLHYDREGVNYSLSGDPLTIHLHWTVMPGHEHDWSRVMVSIIDVSARKKAEDYLKYLGTHDVLTGLYNRTFYEEELTRLERGRRFPVSIIIIDVDGLKTINDTHGHAAGDDLLRRLAEVLKSSFRAEDVAARIGGDEFAALLPNTDRASAQQAVERVQRLVSVNNHFYHGPPLSISAGFDTAERGASLVAAQRNADDSMYQEKRKHKINRLSF